MNDYLSDFSEAFEENSKSEIITLCFSAHFHIRFASTLIQFCQVTHFSHFCSRMEAQCLIKTGLGRFGTVTFREKGNCLIPALCSQSVCLLTGICYIKEIWTIHRHGNCTEAYWESVCLFKARE